MKLNLKEMSLEDKLKEFDSWITPSLGEIKDATKFKEERESICKAFDLLEPNVENEETVEDCTPEKITQTVLLHINSLAVNEQEKSLLSVFSLLFMVTGRSDNNCKCQFPVFLRNESDTTSFPKITKRNGKTIVSDGDIPRVINDERLAKTIATIPANDLRKGAVLKEYIKFILDADEYLKSFWSIRHSYIQAKKDNVAGEFLMPLVVYRVRGSVSASGGHEPEALLRERMKEWGLKQDTDFNANDVVIGQQVQNNARKTRAYDFVLPYQVKGWEQRLFVQCQFYAGDSGSVSHKNVDQLRTARDYTKTKRENPLFLEYVDGAGYFGSLFGDLTKIIREDDTYNFFQVRTSVIKLRAVLQEIGFLTPLEVIHAWSLMKAKYPKINETLVAEGYSSEEIKRVISQGVEDNIFSIEQETMSIDPSRIEIARRYLLLDFIAEKGTTLSTSKKPVGSILVSGYGEYHGLKLADIADQIIPCGGIFGNEWAQNGLILKDIQFLADRGWIKQV